MLRVVVRAWLMIVAIGLCAAPVSAAQASDAGIAATFVAANPHIASDEAAVAKAVKAYNHNHQARPVVRALGHEVGDLRRLARAIGHQRASTGRGRRAKAEIIKGLSLIAGGYSALASDVEKAHAGDPVPSSAVPAAKARARRGRAKLVAGLRLLGLQVSSYA